MTDFVYAFRLAGDLTLRHIRAPMSVEQEAVCQALQAQHGRSVELISLVRSATPADAHIACIDGTDTAPDIAASWERAFARAFPA